MTTDLLPDEVTITVGQDNDKILTAGPYTLNGAVVSRTSKQARFLIKQSPLIPDAQALVDKNSVTHPTIISGSGAEALGIWLIDLRDLLTMGPGTYYYRFDTSASSSANTDRECLGRGPFIIEAV